MTLKEDYARERKLFGLNLFKEIKGIAKSHKLNPGYVYHLNQGLGWYLDIFDGRWPLRTRVIEVHLENGFTCPSVTVFEQKYKQISKEISDFLDRELATKEVNQDE